VVGDPCRTSGTVRARTTPPRGASDICRSCPCLRQPCSPPMPACSMRVKQLAPRTALARR
jgi:hypothetical protein